MPVVIQYFAMYSGGDRNQPYRVDYSGLFSRGFYTRYVGDEAISLFCFRSSEESKTFERLNEDGAWVYSQTIERYVLRGSVDTVEEIDFEEAKRIATMHGKRLRPRRGGRGWVVEWGPLWSPASLSMEGRRATTRVPTQPITTPAPTGTRGLLPKKPIPERRAPLPPLRGRSRFPCLLAKNLYLKGGALSLTLFGGCRKSKREEKEKQWQKSERRISYDVLYDPDVLF